jgi:hypothetical protein
MAANGRQGLSATSQFGKTGLCIFSDTRTFSGAALRGRYRHNSMNSSSSGSIAFLVLLFPLLGLPQQGPLVKEPGAPRRMPLPRGKAPTPWVVVDGAPGLKGGPVFGAANSPRLACSSTGAPTTPPTSTGGSGSFSLKIYEGYRFTDRTVVKSDDKTADITFYPVQRFSVPTPMLGADRIEEFDAKPDANSLSAATIAGWSYYIAAPAGQSYYAIRGMDGRYYLLHLTSFDNGGKATAYWQLNFTWEQVQVRP